MSVATLSAVACRLSFDFDTVVSRAGVPVGSMLLLLRSLVAKSGALVGRLFSVAPGEDRTTSTSSLVPDLFDGMDV